jgi:hypothetical protein
MILCPAAISDQSPHEFLKVVRSQRRSRTPEGDERLRYSGELIEAGRGDRFTSNPCRDPAQLGFWQCGDSADQNGVGRAEGVVIGDRGS